MSVRETVLKSLSAVGAQHEAKFYADLFGRQDAETFAMIVVDPRCLKRPLMEALISALRILANLELTPILIIGALEDERTSIKFQTQIITKVGARRKNSSFRNDGPSRENEPCGPHQSLKAE